jgi:hypothetical protein
MNTGKKVDINTFYRNNKDDINILYKSIIIKLRDLKIIPRFLNSLDFNDFVNFIYIYSDQSKNSYYD